MTVIEKQKSGKKKGWFKRAIDKIGKSDLIKGAVVAGGSSVAMILQQGADTFIETGSLGEVDPKTIAMAAVGGFVTYILKNMFTPTPK